MSGMYYAEGGKVWKRPVRTERPDGSCSISIGFPVCSMHEAAGDEAAIVVAELMNRGEAFSTLLEAAKAHDAYLSVHYSGPDSDALRPEAAAAWRLARAAIRLAEAAGHE